MENNKLSYFSWVPIIGIVMVIIGWTINNNTKTKLFSPTNVNYSVEIENIWTPVANDDVIKEFMILTEESTKLVIDTLKPYVFGPLGGHTEYNKKIKYHQPNFIENFQEISKNETTINEIKAYSFEFTYDKLSDNNVTTMKCKEYLIPSDNTILLLSFHTEISKYDNVSNYFDDVILSIIQKN